MHHCTGLADTSDPCSSLFSFGADNPNVTPTRTLAVCPSGRSIYLVRTWTSHIFTYFRIWRFDPLVPTAGKLLAQVMDDNGLKISCITVSADGQKLAFIARDMSDVRFFDKFYLLDTRTLSYNRYKFENPTGSYLFVLSDTFNAFMSVNVQCDKYEQNWLKFWKLTLLKDADNRIEFVECVRKCLDKDKRADMVKRVALTRTNAFYLERDRLWWHEFGSNKIWHYVFVSKLTYGFRRLLASGASPFLVCVDEKERRIHLRQIGLDFGNEMQRIDRKTRVTMGLVTPLNVPIQTLLADGKWFLFSSLFNCVTLDCWSVPSLQELALCALQKELGHQNKNGVWSGGISGENFVKCFNLKQPLRMF